ncbi:hypothetical protein [Streptomyces sp. NPDC101206]|uniref:hypothetical protein n=1 Tax=Streptomyces sp. NPDC101206 TaxID=3366128 RepID=UPI00382A15E2
MTDDVRTPGPSRPRHAAPAAALLWAVAYAAFGLAAALTGTPLFGGVRRLPAALDWGVVALGALAALVCGAVVRYGLRPLLRRLLRVLCGLAAAAAFGLLMDVIALMLGGRVDSWATTAHHALAAAGALLLAATARSHRDRPPGGAATAPPPPSRAPARVQRAAWAGTVAFLPYAAMKSYWAWGGTFAGTRKEEMLAVSARNGASDAWLTLQSWGVDATALLAALGVFLLWGLIRPWGQVFPRWVPLLHGRRVPRWLPLTPALLGAATLAPYGVLGLAYCALATAGVVTVPSGDFDTPADVLLVAWPGMIAFAGYGIALAAAARSYWLRTSPHHTA